MQNKKGLVWVEKVYYTECPKCSNTIELGSGVSFSKGDYATCNECDTNFELEVKGNE